MIGVDLPQWSSLEGAEGQSNFAGIVFNALSLLLSGALIPDLQRRESPKEELMAFNEAQAERIRQRLVGGVGFLLNGVGVWKDSLIVRFGPEEGEEALKEPHGSEFNITGRAMKGWVLVAPAGVEADDELSGWVQRAVKFLNSLPAK